MTGANECAHPPCGCPVADGEKFCSLYCEDSGKPAELTCECGHRGCKPAGDREEIVNVQ
jgi:hypothetical protein